MPLCQGDTATNRKGLRMRGHLLLPGEPRRREGRAATPAGLPERGSVRVAWRRDHGQKAWHQQPCEQTRTAGATRSSRWALKQAYEMFPPTSKHNSLHVSAFSGLSNDTGPREGAPNAKRGKLPSLPSIVSCNRMLLKSMPLPAGPHGAS